VGGSYGIQVRIDENTDSTGINNCTCPDWIGSDCCQGNGNLFNFIFYNYGNMNYLYEH